MSDNVEFVDETDYNEAETYSEEVAEEEPRLFLETSFSDYSVSEGLLLLLCLFVFMSFCVRIVKEGFSWL